MGRPLALAAVVIALLLNGCGGSAEKPATSSASRTLGRSTRLVDLEHPGKTAALFALFNKDEGSPRLVLLISPT